MGSGYSFDGDDDALDLDNEQLNFDRDTPFSISAFVYGAVPGNCKPFIGKGLLARKSYKGYRFGLDCKRGTALELELIQSHGGGKEIIVTGSTDITEPGFHHVAVTYDGRSNPSGVRLYVNGKQERTVSNLGRLSRDIITGAPFRVGASSEPDYFAGVLDDIKVFSRELSEAEIKELGVRNGASKIDGSLSTKVDPDDVSVTITPRKIAPGEGLVIDAAITGLNDIAKVYAIFEPAKRRSGIRAIKRFSVPLSYKVSNPDGTLYFGAAVTSPAKRLRLQRMKYKAFLFIQSSRGMVSKVKARSITITESPRAPDLQGN